jgi:hypothetical protein
VFPEDPGWSLWLAAPDDLLRGDDEIHAEVVGGLWERLVHYLQLMHGGGQHRLGPKQAGLDEEGNLQVGEAPALADSHSLAVDHHAAADDEIDRPQFADRNLPRGFGRSFFGGGVPWRDVQMLGDRGTV